MSLYDEVIVVAGHNDLPPGIYQTKDFHCGMVRMLINSAGRLLDSGWTSLFSDGVPPPLPWSDTEFHGWLSLISEQNPYPRYRVKFTDGALVSAEKLP